MPLSEVLGYCHKQMVTRVYLSANSDNNYDYTTVNQLITLFIGYDINNNTSTIKRS